MTRRESTQLYQRKKGRKKIETKYFVILRQGSSTEIILFLLLLT
jgi:hypothetical protein